MATTETTATIIPKATTEKPRTPVITEVQVDERTTFDAGLVDGGQAVNVNRDATSLDISLRTGQTADNTPEAVVGDTPPAPEGEVTTEEPSKPVEGEVQDTGTEALKPWNKDDPTVTEAYEKRYFNTAGKLNLEAVTREFWSNAKEGQAGALRDDTYKFIEDTLGVTKEAAQAIEAGLVARQAQENQSFWQRVGGKARYAEALEWGKANYSATDKASFNKAVQGIDPALRDMATDALMQRFERANPQRQQAQRRGPPGSRPQYSPPRSVTTEASPGNGASSNAPYANQQAYQDAFNKAIDAERNARTQADRRAAEAARAKVQKDGRLSRQFWK
jgi:hypothetical protein